jgi:hypothetical protein
VSACTSTGAISGSEGLFVPNPVNPSWAIFPVHDTAFAPLQVLEHASHVGRVIQMACDVCLDMVIDIIVTTFVIAGSVTQCPCIPVLEGCVGFAQVKGDVRARAENLIS